MTRDEARVIARKNFRNHIKADIATLFGSAPDCDPWNDFGFRHGWYHVDGYCFDVPELEGKQYDYTQGGWAYL